MRTLQRQFNLGITGHKNFALIGQRHPSSFLMRGKVARVSAGHFIRNNSIGDNTGSESFHQPSRSAAWPDVAGARLPICRLTRRRRRSRRQRMTGRVFYVGVVRRWRLRQSQSNNALVPPASQLHRSTTARQCYCRRRGGYKCRVAPSLAYRGRRFLFSASSAAISPSSTRARFDRRNGTRQSSESARRCGARSLIAVDRLLFVLQPVAGLWRFPAYQHAPRGWASISSQRLERLTAGVA